MTADEDSAAAVAAGPATRFAGTLMDVLDRVEYSRVKADVVDDPVYRLRYEAYTREGFMDFNPEGVCVDELDTTPNAMCYGIYIDGELVSSLRLHYLTPEHRYSPSMKVCPDILGPMLDAGMRFIDPTRFTADREASLAYPALPFLTLRIAAMASVYFRADYCLALVRPEHTAFYRRVFGSEEMSDVRAYPGLTFPVQLFAAKVDNIRSRVAKRYPFFLSTEEEREALFSQTGERGYSTRIPSTARFAYESASIAKAAIAAE